MTQYRGKILQKIAKFILEMIQYSSFEYNTTNDSKNFVKNTHFFINYHNLYVQVMMAGTIA